MEQHLNNPVGWFEIVVNDMQRAKSFYEAILNVKLEVYTPEHPENFPGMEMLMFPMNEAVYGAGGALLKMPGCHSGVGGTTIYFSCLDCAITSDLITAHGGQIIRAKTSIGSNGFIAMFQDVEGNLLGLHSMQ